MDKQHAYTRKTQTRALAASDTGRHSHQTLLPTTRVDCEDKYITHTTYNHTTTIQKKKNSHVCGIYRPCTLICGTRTKIHSDAATEANTDQNTLPIDDLALTEVRAASAFGCYAASIVHSAQTRYDARVRRKHMLHINANLPTGMLYTAFRLS